MDFNDDKLIHSDTYLGLEFSNELKHYKYIRKEKKNGRWIYYYDDPTKNFDKNFEKSSDKLVGLINKKGISDSKDMEKRYKTDKELKKAADEYEKNRALVKKRNSYSENFKRNMSYTAVQVLNKAGDAIAKGKSKIKKLFKWL